MLILSRYMGSACPAAITKVRPRLTCPPGPELRLIVISYADAGIPKPSASALVPALVPALGRLSVPSGPPASNPSSHSLADAWSLSGESGVRPTIRRILLASPETYVMLEVEMWRWCRSSRYEAATLDLEPM